MFRLSQRLLVYSILRSNHTFVAQHISNIHRLQYLRATLTEKTVVGLFQKAGAKPFLFMMMDFRYIKQVLFYSRS